MTPVDEALLRIAKLWFSEAAEGAGLWPTGHDLWKGFADRIDEVLRSGEGVEDLIADHTLLHGVAQGFAAAVGVNAAVATQVAIGLWSWIGVGRIAAGLSPRTGTPYDQDQEPTLELARCIAFCAIEAVVIPRVANICAEVAAAGGTRAVEKNQLALAVGALDPYYSAILGESAIALAQLMDESIVADSWLLLLVLDQ